MAHCCDHLLYTASVWMITHWHTIAAQQSNSLLNNWCSRVHQGTLCKVSHFTFRVLLPLSTTTITHNLLISNTLLNTIISLSTPTNSTYSRCTSFTDVRSLANSNSVQLTFDVGTGRRATFSCFGSISLNVAVAFTLFTLMPQLLLSCFFVDFLLALSVCV